MLCLSKAVGLPLEAYGMWWVSGVGNDPVLLTRTIAMSGTLMPHPQGSGKAFFCETLRRITNLSSGSSTNADMCTENICHSFHPVIYILKTTPPKRLYLSRLPNPAHWLDCT